MTNNYQQNVTAIQFTGTLENITEILHSFDWAHHNITIDFDKPDEPTLTIDESTFSRGERVKVSNYIVQQLNHDFVIYKADKFKDLFTPTK